MQIIQWTTQKRKVVDLKHWENNPRTITPEKLADLKQKISARGFHDIIKLDEDGTILSGNMRKEALTELGIEEVNVLVPDRKLTEEEKVLIGLESNISEGVWDYEKLMSFDTAILSSAGFESKEIDKIFGGGDDEDDFDAQEEYEKIEAPITKRGDIYKLGEHRLMCGDATIYEDVKKLMGGGRKGEHGVHGSAVQCGLSGWWKLRKSRYTKERKNRERQTDRGKVQIIFGRINQKHVRFLRGCFLYLYVEQGTGQFKRCVRKEWRTLAEFYNLGKKHIHTFKVRLAESI